MNPTSVAKQQRQQEMETIQEEVTRLRELVRSLQDGGSLVQSQDDSIVPNLGLGLPPSKEVLGKTLGVDPPSQPRRGCFTRRGQITGFSLTRLAFPCSNHHTPSSALGFRCFSNHFAALHDLDSDREPPRCLPKPDGQHQSVGTGLTVSRWCCYSWRLLSAMHIPDLHLSFLFFPPFFFKDVLWFWSLLIISSVYICFCLFFLALNINGDSGRRVRLETLGRSFRLFVGYLHLSPDPRVSSLR